MTTIDDGFLIQWGYETLPEAMGHACHCVAGEGNRIKVRKQSGKWGIWRVGSDLHLYRRLGRQSGDLDSPDWHGSRLNDRPSGARLWPQDPRLSVRRNKVAKS